MLHTICNKELSSLNSVSQFDKLFATGALVCLQCRCIPFRGFEGYQQWAPLSLWHTHGRVGRRLDFMKSALPDDAFSPDDHTPTPALLSAEFQTSSSSTDTCPWISQASRRAASSVVQNLAGFIERCQSNMSTLLS